MQNRKKQFVEKFKKYHFELKHLLVVFIVLIFFQIVASLIHKSSLQDLLVVTQDWYQQHSAERLANITATSLELLLATTENDEIHSDESVQKIVEAFNIALSQQILQQAVQEICILITNEEEVFVIDNGQVLYSYMFENLVDIPSPETPHTEAIRFYRELQKEMPATEQIYSVREGKQTFHVFVPFVPKGEYVGAVYVKNTPDFNFITHEVISNYDKTTLIFVALMLLGLLTMFLISSYTVEERDEAQQLFFRERERRLRGQIDHQKEALFTKRIYHTYHKAEKVMGFIKEDLRSLSKENIEEIKYRVTKYANFISRVIYDMKWYDPPLHTVRNTAFQTNLNEVIHFIIQYIFLRVSNHSHTYDFELELDKNLPKIPVNEFVVWEIIEPLLQNSIDHSEDNKILITAKTEYLSEQNQIQVIIADNGKGIHQDLLNENGEGIKRLFLENVSTKKNPQNAGYGCYIAYEMAKRRCGWKLDVENLPSGGCQFTITISNYN